MEDNEAQSSGNVDPPREPLVPTSGRGDQGMPQHLPSMSEAAWEPISGQSYALDGMSDMFSFGDSEGYKSMRWTEGDDPFLGDLASYLDGDNVPCDLAFDPIENDMDIGADSLASWGLPSGGSADVCPGDLDELLEMVDTVGSVSVKADPAGILGSSSLDAVSFSSSAVHHWRDAPLHAAGSSGASTCGGARGDGHFAVASSACRTDGPLTLLQKQATTSSGPPAAAQTGWSGPPAAYDQRLSAGAAEAGWRPPALPTDETSVTSTSPDFPAAAGRPDELGGLSAAQANTGDPYFPLPPLEVVLMSPDARFMHLVQSLYREYPGELRRFMMACAGDRGIGQPPDGQVMPVKSMLELRQLIEEARPMDVVLLERVITESEQNLDRHESMLKEILRIVCRGDMSHWETRLRWGKEERKRLAEESPGAGSDRFLEGFRGLPSGADGEPDDAAFADLDPGDAADDASVTSPDSDIEPDQTDLPQAFCYPKAPDLLRSNRDVAHPHEDAPVADSVCETQFGKVKFSVYPGIRWGRDPLRKKKRLERKLSEAFKGEPGFFICDDLLEHLDTEASVESLVDCLVQHNTRCPKAAAWRGKAPPARPPDDGSGGDWRAPQPAVSHLVIRRKAEEAPLFGGGMRAPPRTMEREEFLSQLADGRMTLAGGARVRYSQLLRREARQGPAEVAQGCLGMPRNEPYNPGPSRAAPVPTPQDISRASQVAKGLLNRQARELCLSRLLSPLKRADAAVDEPKRLRDAETSTKPRSCSGAGTRENGHAARHDSSSLLKSPGAEESHVRALIDALRPAGRSGSTEILTKPPSKKRVLETSDSAPKKTPPFGGQSRGLAKPANISQLPTILLQSIPVLKINRKGPAGRKWLSGKPPLLLPKPPATSCGDPTSTSACSRSSAPSSGADSFSAQPSRCSVPDGDPSLRRSFSSALSSDLTSDLTSGLTSDLIPVPEGGCLTGLEAEPAAAAEMEVLDDQGSPAPAGGGSREEVAEGGDGHGGRRTITEPPSPRSLQVRDKILRAMVSLPDDVGDTSMHYHRPRHCDFSSLTIGGFRADVGAGRGRLKIIYSSRKIIYEFDFPPPQEEAGLRQVVHIEIKFSSVIALQSTVDQLVIVICQIPTVLVGRRAAGQGARPTEGARNDPRLLELVTGDLRDSPMHLLRMTSVVCDSARRTLGRISRRFHNMLCWPLQLDGYVPRWRLVPAGEHSGSAEVTRVGDGTGSRDGTYKWMRSGTQQTCVCKFSCSSLDCPCSRASLPCGYGLLPCDCGPCCSNTFNTLQKEGLDVEAAREDACLVQNVFAMDKCREIRRLLAARQACPHCHLSVQIRDVVPLQRPCPHCTRPVVFSWCQRRLRDSRNHCLVCIGCSDVNFQHCLICKFCTRRSRPRGPCTQCSARGEQWRGGERWRGQRGVVTAESRRCSQQLMTELRLETPPPPPPPPPPVSPGTASPADPAPQPTASGDC